MASDKTTLGDRMKMFEGIESDRKLMPLLPIMARLDGRCFSKFTKGMERPYDKGMSDLMIATTKHMVEKTKANCGYTQSDEITLVYYTEPESNIPQTLFGGRVQKLTSVLASMATQFFNKRLTNFLPAKYADRDPLFDCRVWNVPTLEEAANCFLWRENDCTKNSVSMAARHYYSHKELHGKNRSEMMDMLMSKGVNWNDYPNSFKRGTYVKRKVISTLISQLDLSALPEKHEARKSGDFEISRTVIETLPIPPLTKVKNLVGCIVFDEIPCLNEI